MYTIYLYIPPPIFSAFSFEFLSLRRGPKASRNRYPASSIRHPALGNQLPATLKWQQATLSVTA
jgi:hypothetical protein